MSDTLNNSSTQLSQLALDLIKFRELESELTALREKCEELQRQLDEAAKQEPIKEVYADDEGWFDTDDLSEWAEKGYKTRIHYTLPPNLPSLIEQAKAEEREECAKLADAHFIPGHSVAGPQFAAQLSAAIRARSETK